MEQELPDLNIYISFHEDDRRLVKACVKVLERTIKGGLTGRYNAKFFKTNDVAVGERIGETLDERVESAIWLLSFLVITIGIIKLSPNECVLGTSIPSL